MSVPPDLDPLIDRSAVGNARCFEVIARFDFV
jgi:hypothetical protein